MMLSMLEMSCGMMSHSSAATHSSATTIENKTDKPRASTAPFFFGAILFSSGVKTLRSNSLVSGQRRYAITRPQMIGLRIPSSALMPSTTTPPC